MNHSFDISELENVFPGYTQLVEPLIPKLMDAVEGERDKLISEMLDYPDFDSLRCPIVLICELLGYLCELRCSHDSQIMEYLSLVHQYPILESSAQYETLKQQLAQEYSDLPSALEQFNKVQLLYLFGSLDDVYNSRKLASMLENTIKPGELRINVIYSLAYTTILQKEGRDKDLIRLWLSLILHCFYHDGPESATYILIRWIISFSWQNLLPLKKALLLRIQKLMQHNTNQNVALVLYELFEMAEKLVSPPEKFNYFKRLTKLQPSMLTLNQLQILYFFAGNYTGSLETRFKESILFYQYSNYFLYKCWDQMRNVSEYLRLHMTPEQYYHIAPTLERKVMGLGNQISLQNNAYVETLQANYVKFEQLYEQVEQLSLTDTLTGLRNRRYLQNNIYHMIHLAIRHHVPISFAMIDIDHFKNVNDTYGHAAGDFILKELAQIITKDFRKSDIIVRYGGEEFLMILFDTGFESSKEVMESVRRSVENYAFTFRGQVIPITISVGISVTDTFGSKETDIGTKIAEADKAMYQAKEGGRNRVCIYTET